jgi:mRNA-degrading endonuclease YafQ of YafQ-DinJ toxin-antitoxin module
MSTKRYKVLTNTNFERELKSILKKSPELQGYVFESIKQLSRNPFHITLRTHKVISKKYKRAYSSRVTKDIRIIWDFDDCDSSIFLLTIGTHSGSKKVYN